MNALITLCKKHIRTGTKYAIPLAVVGVAWFAFAWFAIAIIMRIM